MESAWLWANKFQERERKRRFSRTFSVTQPFRSVSFFFAAAAAITPDVLPVSRGFYCRGNRKTGSRSDKNTREIKLSFYPVRNVVFYNKRWNIHGRLYGGATFYIRCTHVGSDLPRVARVAFVSSEARAKSSRGRRVHVGLLHFSSVATVVVTNCVSVRRCSAAWRPEEISSALNFLATRGVSSFQLVAHLKEKQRERERERERKGGGENKVNRSMAKKIGDRSISSDYWPRKGNDRVCSWQIEDRIDVRSFVRCSLLLSTERQLKGRVTRVCLLSMKVKNRQIRLWNECLSMKILTTWCVFRDVFLSTMFKLTIVRCIPTLETFIGVAANVIASAFNQIVKFDEGFFFESMDCLVFIR